MKEKQQEEQHRRGFQLLGKKFRRSTVYLLLLALSYVLGYFCGSSTTTTRTATDGAAVQLLNPIIPIRSNKTLQDHNNNDTVEQSRAQSKSRSTTTDSLSLTPFSSQKDSDHYQFSTQCGAPIPSAQVRQAILDIIFNGTSPFHGFPPPHALPFLHRKRIKGWGSNGAVFHNLIRSVRPNTIIEVGTFLGASAIHMAQVATRLGLLRTNIICIDDFRGWPGFRDRIRGISMVNGDVTLLHQFMQNVAHFNATDTLLPLPFSTASALDKLCEWGVLGDLIEVDAAHDFHSAWSDINRAYKILRPGGVIFGHDYFTAADNRGVRRAVNFFARLKGLQLQLDGQHWVIQSPA